MTRCAKANVPGFHGILWICTLPRAEVRTPSHTPEGEPCKPIADRFTSDVVPCVDFNGLYTTKVPYELMVKGFAC